MFYQEWLNEHIEKDSPIGEFARIVKADPKFPKSESFSSMNKYQESKNAPLEERKLLILSYLEFQVNGTPLMLGNNLDQSQIDITELQDRLSQDNDYLNSVTKVVAKLDTKYNSGKK